MFELGLYTRWTTRSSSVRLPSGCNPATKGPDVDPVLTAKLLEMQFNFVKKLDLILLKGQVPMCKTCNLLLRHAAQHHVIGTSILVDHE